jgi:sodium/hydrogen antiporter
VLDVALAAIAGLALALGLASVPLRDLPVTETLAALVLGVLLGPAAFGVLDLGPHPEPALEAAARIVLAISLMSVALRFSLARVRQHVSAIVLLLTAVLVGMTGITAFTGLTLLGLPLAGAALLGAVLAPTDPVLASNILTGRRARDQLLLRTRVVLSIESGANDGLSFAFVLVAVAAVVGTSLSAAVGLAAVQLAGSVVAGGGIGWAAGRLVEYSEQHRDMEHSAFLTLTLALALFVLGLVDLAGGEGILAVFAAGLAYNHEISRTERREEWEVQEAVNRYLVLPVFTLLGVALPWAGWGDLGWRGVAFAAAVLLLRRFPLVLALRRPLRIDWPEAVFMGWFGPIGVAALYYLAGAHGQGAVDEAVWAAGTLVMAASTVLHGVTAAPGRRAFARAQRRRHG